MPTLHQNYVPVVRHTKIINANYQDSIPHEHRTDQTSRQVSKCRSPAGRPFTRRQNCSLMRRNICCIRPFTTNIERGNKSKLGAESCEISLDKQEPTCRLNIHMNYSAVAIPV